MSRLLSKSGVIEPGISYVAILEGSQYEITVIDNNKKTTNTHTVGTIKGIDSIVDSYHVIHREYG